VVVLWRYMSNHVIWHKTEINRVMCYLKKTKKNYMFAYMKSKSLETIKYFHSNFVRCRNSKDSILGYIFNHDGGVNVLLWGIKPYDMTAKFCHWLACCYEHLEAINYLLWQQLNSVILQQLQEFNQVWGYWYKLFGC